MSRTTKGTLAKKNYETKGIKTVRGARNQRGGLTSVEQTGLEEGKQSSHWWYVQVGVDSIYCPNMKNQFCCLILRGEWMSLVWHWDGEVQFCRAQKKDLRPFATAHALSIRVLYRTEPVLSQECELQHQMLYRLLIGQYFASYLDLYAEYITLPVSLSEVFSADEDVTSEAGLSCYKNQQIQLPTIKCNTVSPT